MTPTTNHAEIPTPRTDAAKETFKIAFESTEGLSWYEMELVRPEQVQQMERELAQANAKLEQIRKLNIGEFGEISDHAIDKVLNTK